MSMLDVLEKELQKMGVFEENMPDIVNAVAESISSPLVPNKMKIAIAVSEIMLYASEFRINIKHWNDSIIPINAITFCIAKSGACKDSSRNSVKKCFNTSYDMIQKRINDLAIDKAIDTAMAKGEENPEEFSTYKKYLKAPCSLDVTISTAEGFVQYLNDLDETSLGAGFMYSGEFGTELATNNDIVDNIKILSEMYDEGNKDVKALKDRTNQAKAIKHMPTSALFMSSQDNLLFNEEIKRKFKTEFTSKLARRSFFVFVDEDIEPKNYDNLLDMLSAERELEDKSKKSREQVTEFIEGLTYDLLNYNDNIINVDEGVRDLFTLYKRYNEEVSNTMDGRFPISRLSRAHMQWKALKLAGALALMENSHSVSVENYKSAIQYVEMISEDVTKFEKELSKEPYETFTEYCKYYAVDHKFEVSLHNARKMGFISSKGQSNTNMKELAKLANSYDSNGTYVYKNDVITYEEIIKSDNILLSYLEVTGTKEYRVAHCASGYQCESLYFEDLEEMLKGDYAYTPFRLLNGVRGNENIDSGCKWIVMDVDDSEITDEETHMLLSDINHYIVRTSHKENPNRYRVIIELDSEVSISKQKWMDFIQIIANDLGLKADKLGIGQIFLSYRDRNILKETNAEPLHVKEYLTMLNDKPIKDIKKPNKATCSSMLDDPLSTFEMAFNAKDGEGRRKLIWACKYARELGADRNYCHNLIDKISEYWVKPLPEQDLAAMHRQLERWVF